MRFGIAAAAALAFGQSPALAQETPPGNTSNTIGPRDLQGFSLNGAVTRPAPEREEPQPAPVRTPPAASTPAPTRPDPARSAPAATERPAARPAPRDREPAPAPTRQAAPVSQTAPAPASSVTVSLPPADALSDAPSAGPEPAFTPEPLPPSSALAGNQGLSPLPWILALLLLGGAAAFYFHRQRSRGEELAFAGAPAEAFVPPPPAPAPPARAPEPAPAPPASTGIVSTRLRPWVEIEFEPLRCIVEESRASIEFNISLFNSGSAPARDVLIEAAMINAGQEQDREIAAFFGNPRAEGQRIPAIPPLQRVAIKSTVGMPIEQLRHFEAKGRRFFVPLIAFNALYRWGSNEGQSSLSFLVGRDGQGDKMAPFRLDLGPRIFRGLGAREHELRIRR